MLLPKVITIEVCKDGKSIEVSYDKFIDIVIEKQRRLRATDVTDIMNNINKLHEEGELSGGELNLDGFTFKVIK